MKFTDFVDHADRIAAVPGDDDTIARTSDLLREASNDEADTDTIRHVTRFIQGRAFASSDPRKLDIGAKLCHEAIARAASAESLDADAVSDLVVEEGGVGKAVDVIDFGGQTGLAAFGGSGGSDGVTIGRVADVFHDVATTTGAGSTETRLRMLFGLFNDCTQDEIRVLARIMVDEMRIGVGEGTVRDAIAEAFGISIELVEDSLQVANDYGLVAETAAVDGSEGLSNFELEVGRPIKCMLAQKGTAEDAASTWGEVAVQSKYDGARAQVHYDGETVTVFSRRLENITDSVPEVVEAVEANATAPAIFDGEIVAYDSETGRPEPFEMVLQRIRREDNVQKMMAKVPVRFRPFDCLYYNGESLLTDDLTDRHDHLKDAYADDAAISTLHRVDTAEGVVELEQQALDDGHEGVMLKNPDAEYIPGDRGREMLKLKPDVETLDLAVIGGEWGEGRRSGFVGSVILGTKTPDGFKAIGKAATGISDDELAELTDLVTPHVRSDSGQEFDAKPEVVVEIGYQDIQESPEYESGYALRFPRFKVFRHEKPVEEVDDIEKVERLFAQQSG
jgi:DNA ligase-1